MRTEIRKSNYEDAPEILRINREAFGGEKGVEVSDLVSDLLEDSSADPMLSLLAIGEDKAVGHILFSRARIEGSDDEIRAALLAPLAVVPECHAQGIGGRLIREGLRILSESGVRLVFVLGHPSYYPNHGFTPACPHGFEAPFQPPGSSIDAWMVQGLTPGAIESAKGRILCADALNELRYWRE